MANKHTHEEVGVLLRRWEQNGNVWEREGMTRTAYRDLAGAEKRRLLIKHGYPLPLPPCLACDDERRIQDAASSGSALLDAFFVDNAERAEIKRKYPNAVL